MRKRPPAIAVAISSAPAPGGEAVLLAYHSPRTTVMWKLPGQPPAPAAAELAGPDPIVAILPPRGSDAEGLGALARALRAAIRSPEIITLDPRAALRFLWLFRDEYDPMALGHASDRRLFDATSIGREVPDIRASRGRGASKRAAGDLVRMLLEVGAGIGVRPPLAESGETSPARLAPIIDTCAGLYVALLSRWGSPLAVRCGDREGVPEYRLADRWMREEAPAGG